MATKSNTPHVLIVGAGLAGLTLAQCLRKLGVTFEVFERDTSANNRRQGWSIGLYNLEDVQAAMPDDVPSLRSCCHLLPLDLPSQIVFHGSAGRFGVQDTPQTSCTRVDRMEFREALSTNIPVRWNKKAVKIEKTVGGVTVSFADGSSAAGDILVGADGTFSVVREHVLGKSNKEVLRPVPQAVIVGETVIHDIDTLRRQMRLGYSAYIVPASRGYIFNGLHRVNYAPPNPETPKGNLVGDGDVSGLYWFMFSWDDPSIADPTHWLRTASKEDKYAYVRKMTRSVDPRLRELVDMAGPESIRDDFIMYWDAIIPELPVSRATLVGDAAHPMTPFRGEGGIIAIQDALRLSEVLAQLDKNDESALQSALDVYQREITARGVESIIRSREQAVSAGKPESRLKSWGHEMVPMPEKPVELRLVQ